MENLSWEVEVLKQKYDRALRERDEIHERFSSAIIDMQQKSGLKYKILEKKIVSMREQLDVKDAQLHATTKGNYLFLEYNCDKKFEASLENTQIFNFSALLLGFLLQNSVLPCSGSVLKKRG